MEIIAHIKEIKYKVHSPIKLKDLDFKDFNINKSPAYCLLNLNNSNHSLSNVLVQRKLDF